MTQFQHNRNKEPMHLHSLKYVREYKRQLMVNINKLLRRLNIKYVIDGGNLLEYTRGKMIQRDNDIDIRFDINDFHKWEKFCNENKKEDVELEYNLKFCWRFNNIDGQLYNGINIQLLQLDNVRNINVYDVGVHLDLVVSKVTQPNSIWPDHDIDWDHLREVGYLGVNTYAPSIEDTKRKLVQYYGDNYMIQNHKSVVDGIECYEDLFSQK